MNFFITVTMMLYKLCIIAIGLLAAVITAMPLVSPPLASISPPTIPPLTMLTQGDASDTNSIIPLLSQKDNSAVHLGSDGVLRSYHPNGTVIDYARLDTEQIKYVVSAFGAKDCDLSKSFEGVNGHDVTNEKQLFRPGDALLPHQFKAVKPESSCGGGQRRDTDSEYFTALTLTPCIRLISTNQANPVSTNAHPGAPPAHPIPGPRPIDI